MATIENLLRTDFKAVDKHDEVRTVFGWITGDAKDVPLIVDDGKPVGILNERALMSRRLEQKAKLDPYTLMTRALPLNATLEAAAARMREFRAARLPVEDARGKLAGYVTAIDIARAHAAEKRGGPAKSVVRTGVRRILRPATVEDLLELMTGSSPVISRAGHARAQPGWRELT